MKKLLSTLLVALLVLTSCGNLAKEAKHTFAVADGNFLYDGKPVQIHSGEMHFARIPAPYWRHRLKMMKAMGLNTVATYVFWNYHETAPGVWDFKSESRNIAEFIKIAGEEGLMVILRPGPYACAEWEFGGYPWWLQKTPGLVIRTDNKLFLDSCKVYINKLAEQVRDLQITKGGPLIMVQAENEFGSYVAQRPDISLETHKKYSAAIRLQLIEAGFDIPMFTSDGSWLFEGGSIEGALPTANGESNIKNLKQIVNQYNGGKGPYMVAEFYPGWLDHWAEPFPKSSARSVAGQTAKYLRDTVSFNFYMVHGGTNFGFTSGANYSSDKNIQPDMTTYDYDAPISEAGWATEKYMAIRDTMKKYVDYEIPAIPEQIPVIEIPTINLTKSVNLFDMVSGMTPAENDTVMSFEDLNQGHGYVLYRRHFNQPIKGELKITGIRDYALVYVNGKKVGELNRVFEKDSMQIDIPFNSTLDILVENMGRINYGAKIIYNSKGLITPVKINGIEMTGNWEMYKLPMSEVPELKDLQPSYTAGQPVIYEGEFSIDKVGDTFLNMDLWGKGIVFVNGFNLGRYWKVGPQQTLYLPGCLLKKGSNKIVIFEQQNDTKQTTVSGVKVPVVDQLKLDRK